MGSFALDAAGFGKTVMGKRGPRPKLPEIARLEGNPGKRKLSPPTIRATGDVFIPNHLDESAKDCLRLVMQAMPPGVYTAADIPVLSAFATAWSIHRRAVEEMNKPGFERVVGTARGGRQVNAWLRLLNQQAEMMASLGDRLGLNPKARATLLLPEENRKSKFDGLLGGV